MSLRVAHCVRMGYCGGMDILSSESERHAQALRVREQLDASTIPARRHNIIKSYRNDMLLYIIPLMDKDLYDFEVALRTFVERKRDAHDDDLLLANILEEGSGWHKIFTILDYLQPSQDMIQYLVENYPVLAPKELHGVVAESIVSCCVNLTERQYESLLLTGGVDYADFILDYANGTLDFGRRIMETAHLTLTLSIMCRILNVPNYHLSSALLDGDEYHTAVSEYLMKQGVDVDVSGMPAELVDNLAYQTMCLSLPDDVRDVAARDSRVS